MVMLASVLLGCHDGVAADDAPSTDAPVPQTCPLDWGLSTCGTPGPSGGFEAFFAQRNALLVYGPDDAALAARVRGWYASSLSSLELRLASELTDAERRGALMVIGTTTSNPLLTELSATLPVCFEAGRFTFAGYRWEEPGHGIAITAPNPWNADATVLVYAANFGMGTTSPFSVPTGRWNASVMRGRASQLHGPLCQADTWTVDPSHMQDQRQQWDAFVQTLQVRQAGDHHVLLYEAGSGAERDIEWFAGWLQERMQEARTTLELSPPAKPIRHYLYASRASKERQTGDPGNAHANTFNYEVHELYSLEVAGIGPHESIHVLTDEQWGPTSTALLGEGTAVYGNGGWAGESLAHWVARYRADESLPPLARLISNFRDYPGNVTYPVAGHFVGWVKDKVGMVGLKRIYTAANPTAELESVLGKPLSAIEAEWLASVAE